MSYRDDEAHNFSKSLDSLQDRAEFEPETRVNRRDDLENDVRAAYAKAKIDAAAETGFEEHHERSTRNGVDSAEALGHMGAWYQGMMDPRTTARTVTELRMHAIGAPPRPQQPKPAANNEPLVVMTPAQKEEQRERELRDVYSDVKRSIADAQKLTDQRNARQRAEQHVSALKQAHGRDAGEVMRAMGNMWDSMLDDPVKNAPKVLHAAVAEQWRQAGLQAAHSEIGAFSKDHRKDMNNPAIRARMVEILNQMPRNTENALEVALAAAKEDQRGYWYRDGNARRDDIEDDVAVAARYGRPAKSW